MPTRSAICVAGTPASIRTSPAVVRDPRTGPSLERARRHGIVATTPRPGPAAASAPTARWRRVEDRGNRTAESGPCGTAYSVHDGDVLWSVRTGALASARRDARAAAERRA